MRSQAVAAVVVVALATAGGVLPQCPEESYKGTQINMDLSGITDFGLDLYRQLSPASSPSNFFFSPYSIWTALALAYLGSNGNTKLQLETALRIKDKASTYGLLNALKERYQQRPSNWPFTVGVANRVYYDSSLNLRSCIQDLLRDEVKAIDFGNAIGAAKDINNFVSNTTRGRIKEIVSPQDLRTTVMALVNAVYFNGTWNTQFDSANTLEKPFYVTPQQSELVSMMAAEANFGYGESQELRARVLDVPYLGFNISMVLLLPTEEGPRGFQDMVEALNGADLHTVLDKGLESTYVELQLPRFKLEHSYKDELKTALENLGVRDLFSSQSADLSDFVRDEQLHASQAIHKAFVEVTERGTEAGAATALLIDRIHNPTKVRFHCNRPFLFLIRDRAARNVLFFGAYYRNPAS